MLIISMKGSYSFQMCSTRRVVRHNHLLVLIVECYMLIDIIATTNQLGHVTKWWINDDTKININPNNYYEEQVLERPHVLWTKLDRTRPSL